MPSDQPATPSATPPTRGREFENRFGVSTATAVVIGSIIGTGVFALPSALAPYGTSSLVAFVLVTVGALALASVFGKLNRRVPGSGGPYLYSRAAFGDFAGFTTAWTYWLTAWIGNAAVVVAWVGYVQVFINKNGNRWGSAGIALVGLWIPAAINLSGVRNLARFQTITTVLKFVPLVFMATIGLLFVKSANFGPFNASGVSLPAAISAAAAIALFSYLGLETVSVVAGRVRDPEKNVGRATVYGTLACAAVYILGTIAVFGTVGHEALLGSTAPFADAAEVIFGSAWAAKAMAGVAIISGIGCLNGWTLIVAEMPMAAAHDGLFPERFARVDHREIPVFGILAGAVAASVLTTFAYFQFQSVFTQVVLLSVLTSVIPYLYSAAAQLLFVLQGRNVERRTFVRDGVVALGGLAFSFWALAGTGYQAVYYGAFGLLIGVPVYVFMKARPNEPTATAAAPLRIVKHRSHHLGLRKGA